MPSTQLSLVDLQSRYGGEIKSGYLRGAIVAGQPCSLYFGGDQLVVDGTTGPYTAQQLGLAVNIELGRPLPPYAARAAEAEPARLATPTAANDNTKPELLTTVLPSRWHDLPVPAREWFAEGFIPSGTVTLLSGDGGLGKSLAALQLGLASVLGCQTMGMSPAQGPVIYVGAEDDVDEFHRRIAEVLESMGYSFADLGDGFHLLPLADRDAVLGAVDRDGKIKPSPLHLGLLERVAAIKPGLVVLDTSADLFGGDEIKRAQVRQFVAMLRRIAIEHSCAVLLLSHPSVAGMQSGSGTSGSTAWNNSVRSRLYLTAPSGEGADPDERIITVMKANYGRTGAQLRLRWEAGAFVVSDEAKPSPAMGLLNRKADETFLALLSKLNQQGQSCSPNRSSTYAPTVMSRHPIGKPVGKAALEAAMIRLLDDGAIKVVTDGPPSKPRSRLWVTAEAFGS